MVYTVTFNPSIDYVVRMNTALKPGMTNRSSDEAYYIGGKGNNVSFILKELGVDSVALGFAGGFTGEAIINGLNEKGINADYVKIGSGNSRINIKLKGVNSEETEINANGPSIPGEAISELYNKLDVLKKGDFLVLAGSIPSSLPHTIYEDILEKYSDRGVNFIVDASGDLLKAVLKFRPFLVKPNKQELSEMFNTDLSCDEDIDIYASKLRELGAVNVLVSLGGDGARLYTEFGDIIAMPSLEGKLVNSVGAGDSMVAGFLAGYLKYSDYVSALKLGIAAGAATAFSEDLAVNEKIMGLFDSMHVEDK